MVEASFSGFDPSYYEMLARVEEHHFWFRARNAAIAAAIPNHFRNAHAKVRILEVGCGNGNVLGRLASACPGAEVVGIDLYREGLTTARRRTGLPVVVGDVRKQPFGCYFDMVGTFDVLEHIPDDTGACQDIYRLLRPGGCLLATVPAHPSLWSSFDEVSCHCRRYTEACFQKMLTDVGFRVDFLSLFMGILYPIMLLTRHRNKPKQGLDGGHRAASRDLRVIPFVNEVFRLALVPEAALLRRRVRLQWGTSLLAVATRP